MDSAISSEKQYGTLAYVFGFFLGDGTVCTWVDKRGRCQKRFMLRKPDKDPITHCARLLAEVFGVTRAVGTVKYKNTELPMVQLQGGAPEFDVFFYETVGRTRAPEWLLSSQDFHVLRHFLAGLVDSDGHVSFTRRPDRSEGQMHCQVGFTSTEPEIARACEAVARRLGILVHEVKPRSSPGAAHWKARYDVLFNVKSFILAGIPLRNARKVEKLKLCQTYLLGSETLYAAPETGEDKVHPHGESVGDRCALS
jgi:hypothetical protein